MRPLENCKHTEQILFANRSYLLANELVLEAMESFSHFRLYPSDERPVVMLAVGLSICGG